MTGVLAVVDVRSCHQGCVLGAVAGEGCGCSHRGCVPGARGGRAAVATASLPRLRRRSLVKSYTKLAVVNAVVRAGV
eukprot:56502-Chlamydomonas_euryale.AAC.5